MADHYDAIVIGSGFSGSILGWILAKRGRRVLLVDSGRHPRFAIGESSTPTADFLIHQIAEQWGLPELAPLACWGTWKAAYPDLVCGKKRGFSYYRHNQSQPFQDDAVHSQSLLVAASCDDRYSDTHWLRSSVDHFLVKQAEQFGCHVWDLATITSAAFDAIESRWQINVMNDGGLRQVSSRWLVDASGGGGATAAFLENGFDDQWMRTRTRATFGHYVDVQPFVEGWAPDDPFCGDDAAQHHLIDNGWWWMLRFDNGVTSVGLVEPLDQAVDLGSRDADQYLRESLARYPSLERVLKDARIVAPLVNSGQSISPQGHAIQTGRLSRCRSAAAGPGWILLPNAFGFVDPLHSTGIAHSLSGIDRVARLILSPSLGLDSRLRQYDEDLHHETQWLDTLIAGCYAAMPNFRRFCAMSSFYFVAAIEFEKVLASGANAWPQGFMQARDPRLLHAAQQSLSEASNGMISDGEFVRRVRQRIAPWNRVGLLDPDANNRLAHTSAPKFAS